MNKSIIGWFNNSFKGELKSNVGVAIINGIYFCEYD
jgi:hypothetical protein